MTGGCVEGAACGAVFQEGVKLITNQISKALKFKTTRKNLASLVDHNMPAAKEMKVLDQKLEHPKDEADRVIENLEQGEKVVNKYTKVPWWKCCCLPCYQGELHAKEKEIVRANTLILPVTTARDIKKTLCIVGNLKGRQYKRLSNAPIKPDFTVGLDVPLHQLKNWVLSSGTGVSVRVLTGLAGSGKTTLATLLCWDDEVRGNIYNSLSALKIERVSGVCVNNFYYLRLCVNVVFRVGVYIC